MTISETTTIDDIASTYSGSQLVADLQLFYEKKLIVAVKDRAFPAVAVIETAKKS